MSIKYHLFEYFSSAGIPAPDARVGTAIGTTATKGVGAERPYQKMYPYVEPPEDFDEEEEDDFFSDTYGDDRDIAVKLANKAGVGYVANDAGGVGVGKRYDNRSTTTNQRLGLNEDIPMRKGDSLHGSMSPIPFKALYRKFSGPAIGGTSAAASYTTGPGPGRAGVPGLGTQYGSSRPPVDGDDGVRIMDFTDIVDPDERSLNKSKNDVRRVQRRNLNNE